MTTKKSTTTKAVEAETTTEIETVELAATDFEKVRLQLVKANAIVDAFVRHGFAVHGGVPQVLQIERAVYDELGGNEIELSFETPYFTVRLEPRA
jgi:hypothetical protein